MSRTYIFETNNCAQFFPPVFSPLVLVSSFIFLQKQQHFGSSFFYNSLKDALSRWLSVAKLAAARKLFDIFQKFGLL